MPFKSRDQSKKCFSMRGRGQAKGWDCEEWARKTNYKKLPEKKAALIASLIATLEKQASTSAQRLGVRAAGLLIGVPASPSRAG
jgi:hypothetical protein